MIDKRYYTVRCCGGLTSQWLADFLLLFKEHAINIRKLVMVPQFSVTPKGITSSRLEVEFEIPNAAIEADTATHPFLDLVESRLETLPTPHEKSLQRV
jgi:hypothetical protein